MVGSVDKPGGSGQVRDVSKKQETHHVDGDEHKLKHSAVDPDGFKGTSYPVTPNYLFDVLPTPTEKKAPPQPNNQALKIKLQGLGYSDEQIQEIIGQARGQDLPGLPGLDDYANSDRFELRARQTGHDGHDPMFDYADQELSEMFMHMYTSQMLDQLEDREIARVFLAMSAIAHNPKYAARKLADLAGSAQTPEAKALASGQLSNAMSFAIKWALKVAKTDPEFAKQLSQSLKGIVVQDSNSTGMHHSHIHLVGNDTGGNVPNADHEHGADTVTENTIEVVDKETNQVVDAFIVEVHNHGTDFNHQRAHAEADQGAQVSITEASREADSAFKDAQRIHDESQEAQRAQVQNAETVKNLDGQLLAAKNDPEQLSALKAERSNVQGQGRFIARA